MKKKCLKKFLFLKWFEHNFEIVDIAEDVKIIGKKLGEHEVGIYIRRFITTTTNKCKNCGKIKKTKEEKEETIRQYY